MAPRIGIKGADAHQPVHALLSAQESIHIFTRYLKGYALDSRLIPVKQVQHLDAVPVPFTVTGIHPVQHLCPVLCLCSAGTGVQGQIGVAGIIVTPQQRLQFQGLKVLRQSADFLTGFGDKTLILHLLRQFHGRINIVCPFSQPLPMLDLCLCRTDLLADLRGTLKIIPEVRFVHGFVHFEQLLSQSGDVKVTHLPQRCFRGFLPAAGDRVPVRSR